MATACSSNTGSDGDGVSVLATFSSANGATDQALTATVTVTFSSAITEPADWTVVLTLKKDGVGDTLCTAVTYEAETLTATCAHDTLEVSSSYTLALSGLTGVSDASVTFTTTATTLEPNISSLVDGDGGWLLPQQARQG